MAMKSILVDTNAYAAFKRGDVEALAILRAAAMLGAAPMSTVSPSLPISVTV